MSSSVEQLRHAYLLAKHNSHAYLGDSDSEQMQQLESEWKSAKHAYKTASKKEIPKMKKRKLVTCTNTTGFNGVSKNRNKFQARISINGKDKHLGYFTKARDAAMAYDEAIVKYHQPRTKFNFPEGMPIEDQSDDDDGYWM